LSNSRNTNFALPAIHVSDLSTSSRFRRVEFGDEQIKNPIPQLSSSHRQSTLNKTRLKPLSTELSHHLPPIDLNLSSSSRTLHQHGHRRSILRKQNSSSSSNTTDIINRKVQSRILTPLSKDLGDIPLGTRSQRLFGGSEFFAQIMNELEQQNK
jgi:hypothetical protein